MSELVDGREGRSLELKVGAFVLALLGLGALVLVLLGQESQVWKPRVELHTSFTEVQGLEVGAPVRIAGVSVGSVSRVGFGRERGDRRIHVDFNVRRDSLERITHDSVARIASQGLLGDKLLEITVGAGAPVAPGGEIVGAPPADLNLIIEKASAVIDRAVEVADHIEVATRRLAEPRTIDALQGAILSLRQLLRSAERGPGLVHALFYDRRTNQRVDEILATVSTVVSDVDQSLHRIDHVLAATDEEGAQVVNNISRAAASVGDTASALQRGQIVKHLDQAASDVAALTSTIRAGRGTIGGLIQDRTVYDQLVTVLGGIGRSRVLRALVRFAIASDEEQVMGKTLHPVPAAPPPPPAPGHPPK